MLSSASHPSCFSGLRNNVFLLTPAFLCGSAGPMSPWFVLTLLSSCFCCLPSKPMASPSPLTALVPFLPRLHFTTLQVRSPAGGHFSPHFLCPPFQAQDGEQHPARTPSGCSSYTLKILWDSSVCSPKKHVSEKS